jgi:hypothetical protein
MSPFVFLLVLVGVAVSQDVVPANPSIDPAQIRAAAGTRPSVDITCSEAVSVFLQGSFDAAEAATTRTACPHDDGANKMRSLFL